MRSLFAGVSGLKVHQTRMDNIGNNIANVNTVGFKSTRTTFSDILSQTQSGASAPTLNIGGTNPKQIGLGVAVASMDLLFTDGSSQSTGKNTDLCLNGNGLFVVKNGDSTYYTRNGSFTFDEQGYYVMPGNGLKVQGWNAVDGSLNTNSTPEDIIVPTGKTMEAQATKQVSFSGNLNANSPLITSIDGETTTDLERIYVGSNLDTADEANRKSAYFGLTDNTNTTVTTGEYSMGHSIPLTTVLQIYDSEGMAHNVSVLLEKVHDNCWQVKLPAAVIPSDDPGTGAAVNPELHTIEENDGTYTSVKFYGESVEDQIPALYVNFNEDGSYLNVTSDSTTTESAITANIVLQYNRDVNGEAMEEGTERNGAEDTTATINFSGLSQYVSNSTAYPTADGNVAGTLVSVSVDGTGVITGTYTNGKNQFEAQVAVAQFINAAGLTKNGESLYAESNNSGSANIKTAPDLGLTIIPSSLEMSNVDLANEFSEMIITQRGFQANSKIINVGDEMLETLVNMKR